VLHPGRPNVPHSEIQKELAEKYRAKPNCVFTFGMKCSFGGGKSTGFGLIYDNEAKAMASEPQWRLVRVRAAPSPRRRSARISRGSRSRSRRCRSGAVPMPMRLILTRRGVCRMV